MPDMPEKEFSLVGSDQRRLFARCWNPEDVPLGVVGIVHGLGEHCGRYDYVAVQLVQAGFAVVGYDQTGHGKNEGRRGVAHYDRLLDDVGCLLAECERRFSGRPLFLYGHSFGGNLVLNYALRRQSQLAGIIATSPLLEPTVPPPKWKVALAHLLNHIAPHVTFSKGVNAEDLSHDAESIELARNDPLMHHCVSARLAIEMLDAGLWAIQHAEQLHVPLLLMHGSEDGITSAEASRRFAAAAGCTLKIWDGLLHELHWESQRQEVMQTITHWLSGRANDPANCKAES